MEELDLVKEQWDRLPSRGEILRLTLGAWRAVLVVLPLIRRERGGTAT
jgi:hypothetical protein